MASLADCLTKAVKAGMLSEEESDFVLRRSREASDGGMTRKESELWAAREMLRDAMAELDSIARQVRGPGKQAQGPQVVFRSRSKDAAMAAMLEEVQTVTANKLAQEAGEGRVVAESQAKSEGELTKKAEGGGDKTRTYEVMREKVLGMIRKDRNAVAERSDKLIESLDRQQQEIEDKIRELEFKGGMVIGSSDTLTRAEMKEQGVSEAAMLRIKYEKELAAIKAKRDAQVGKLEISREKMLSALGELNAVMKFLPPEVRGKAGGFYQIAKSEAPLGKILSERLQRVADELEKLMHREYSGQIKKLLGKSEPKKGENRVLKSTLGPEAQASANVASAAAELDADATARRLSEIEAALSQTDLDPEQQAALQEEWAIVNAFGDLKNRSVEQLAAAYHWLKEMTAEGRSKWRAQEKARIEGNKAKAEAITQGLPEVTNEGLARLNTKDIKSWADSIILSHYSLAQFLNHLLPDGAKFKAQWADRARRADNASHDMAIDASKRLTAALQEAIGDKGRVKMAKVMGDLKVRTANINGAPMSKLEAIQYILSWDQPDVRAKMEATGWKAEHLEEMRNLTRDKASQAILEFLRDEYQSTYDLINPVYRRMFGMDMPRMQNYAPTKFLHGDEDTDLSPLGGVVAANGITPGFAKARVRHDARMRQADALTVYWQHIGQATHWANYAELMREMRGVLNSQEVKLAVQSKYGADVSKLVNNWLDTLSRQGTNRASEVAWMNKLLDGLVQAKAVSALGFNLRSIVMQLDSAFRATLALPTIRVVAALSDRNFTKNIAQAWHSDTIQRRVMSGGSPEARYLFDQTQTKPSWILELARMSMMPMQLADAGLTSFSSAIVYTDAYNQAKANGASDSEAEGLATDAMDDAVYRFSQPIGISSKSLMETSGSPLRKMFMLFMSDPRLKTAYMAEAIRGLMTGKGNSAEHVRRILAIESMAVVSQIVANVFRDVFVPGDDDEERSLFDGIGRAAALAPLQGWFFFGSLFDIAVSKLLEGRAFVPSRDPLIEAGLRFERALKHSEDIFNFDDPSKMLKEWDHIARSFVLAGAAFGPATAGPAVLVNLLKPIVGAAENIKKEE